MCTEQWLKQDIRCNSRVLTNAQILEDIEEQEKIERGIFVYFLCFINMFLYMICFLLAFVFASELTGSIGQP